MQAVFRFNGSEEYEVTDGPGGMVFLERRTLRVMDNPVPEEGRPVGPLDIDPMAEVASEVKMLRSAVNRDAMLSCPRCGSSPMRITLTKGEARAIASAMIHAANQR